MFARSRRVWPELVEEACRVSTYAVELSALSGAELPGLLAYLDAQPRLPFRYVSVHGPAKDLEPNDRTTIRLLKRLPLWVRAIVMHPDSLSDPEPYRELGTRLVLENMDDRKATGRTVEEIESCFARLPGAGFCLDVAHAYSLDPSMAVAHDLLDRFRSRLRHVHLSSLRDGHHVPLTEADEDLFVEVLDRCRDVPWILEALPPDGWARALKANPLVPVAASIPLDAE